jgi:hypothetical protein
VVFFTFNVNIKYLSFKLIFKKIQLYRDLKDPWHLPKIFYESVVNIILKLIGSKLQEGCNGTQPEKTEIPMCE